MSARLTHEALPALRFRLPGTWWEVPLHDADRARQSVRRLVRDRVGTADDRATLRHDLQGGLLEAVDAAIEGEGQSMFVALEIMPGIPLPVSFVVMLPRIGMSPTIGTERDAVADVLQQGIEARGESFTRFHTARSTVVRTLRTIASERPDTEPIDTLVVDYWMTVPATKRVVLVSFTTALAPLQEQLLVLFDSIIRAAWWQTPTIASA